MDNRKPPLIPSLTEGDFSAGKINSNRILFFLISIVSSRRFLKCRSR